MFARFWGTLPKIQNKPLFYCYPASFRTADAFLTVAHKLRSATKAAGADEKFSCRFNAVPVRPRQPLVRRSSTRADRVGRGSVRFRGGGVVVGGEGGAVCWLQTERVSGERRQVISHPRRRPRCAHSAVPDSDDDDSYGCTRLVPPQGHSSSSASRRESSAESAQHT